jgi:carboxypeptidase T
MTPRALLLCLLVCATAEARTFTYTAFRTPAQIEAAFASLAAANPGLTTWTPIGNSLNGVPIKALKISSTPSMDDPAKDDVVFVGLHHAREWMTPETALFLADELLTLRATDAELQVDMDRLQIWIVPVVNPDGYAYTVTTDRFWRKNRRVNADGSHGVDLNRNWGFQWGLASGSSPTPSVDTYHGTGAFSEPETVVIRNFLNARRNLKVFVTYHSFSELYLVPWSYTKSPTPGDPTLHAVNDRNIVRVAGVHGHTYTNSISYTSSGEATDWVWDQFRVYAATPEVRPAVGAPSCPFSDLGALHRRRPRSCPTPKRTSRPPERWFTTQRAQVCGSGIIRPIPAPSRPRCGPARAGHRPSGSAPTSRRRLPGRSWAGRR